MIRSFLCWLLSFTIALPAWALTPEQTKTVQSFLKMTGVATRGVPWKEYYAKVEKDLPYDVRREMTLFLKQYPNAKLPKVKVTKLKEGSSEVVQLEFRVGRDQAFLRIENGAQFATLKGVQAGQKFNVRIGEYELKHPARFMAGLTGIQPWTEKVPTVQVLSSEEVKLLKPQERQKYIDRFRAVLEAAEKVQNSLDGKKKQSSDNRDFFWSLVNAPAWAGGAEGGTGLSGNCIVAGSVGQYESNSCSPPADRRRDTCVQCNPEIYGGKAPCIPFVGDSGRLPENATEQCNQQTESNKYAVFQGVQNSQDVQKRKDSISGTLTNLTERCQEIADGAQQGTKWHDQPPTCVALNGRVQELRDVQCDILKQQGNQFPGLTCSGGDSAPPVALPGPGNGDGGPPPPGVPGPGGSDGGGSCTGLPSNPEELKCTEAQRKPVNCGENSTLYRCVCGSNENDDIPPGAQLPTGCKPKGSPSDTGRQHGGREGSGSHKKEESWFKPWMGVALAGGAGLLLWYWISKQNMQAAYAPYNNTTPVNTPVPPPISTTTTPGLQTLPAPVEVNRSAPATR